MASIHCLLSQIPDNLDFETILTAAETYYKDYSPDRMEKLVRKRVDREYVDFGLLVLLRKLVWALRKVVSLSWYLVVFASLGPYRHRRRNT